MKSKYPIVLHGVDLTLRELDAQDVSKVLDEWKMEKDYSLHGSASSLEEFPLAVDARREEKDLVRI